VWRKVSCDWVVCVPLCAGVMLAHGSGGHPLWGPGGGAAAEQSESSSIQPREGQQQGDTPAGRLAAAVATDHRRATVCVIHTLAMAPEYRFPFILVRQSMYVPRVAAEEAYGKYAMRQSAPEKQNVLVSMCECEACAPVMLSRCCFHYSWCPYPAVRPYPHTLS
jgi:hypothetical protein